MAEFPELGQHCQQDGCNCMDFLPFICKNCKKFYCKEHRFYHTCDDKVEPRINSSASGSLYHPCSIPDCFGRSFYNISCNYCNQAFCHPHRLPENHECEHIPQRPSGSQSYAAVLPVERPPMKYEPINIQPKYYERFRKLALMRHKSRMLDRYRSTENVIFTLRIDENTVYPVCVPAFWTLSRCLSSILEQCNLSNDSSELSKYNLRHPNAPDEDIDFITVMCAVVKEHEILDLLLVKST